MTTLFDDQEPRRAGASASGGPGSSPTGTPLAERIRPRTLDEVVGQDPVVGEGAFLRRAIARDRVPSLVF